MKAKFARLSVFVAVALVVIGAAVSGCGGDASGSGGGGGAESEAAYDALLIGLRHAALSNHSYNAVERAQKLEKAEKLVVEAFCEATQEILEGPEIHKHFKEPYFSSRIRNHAEQYLIYAPKSASAAMSKIEAVLNLSSFSIPLAKRYEKACFH